jgi:succinoglycan biosynthesis protein ExoA
MTASDNTQPNVSIVIPCRNERDHVETVLRSILTQDPPPGGFELIIADGMSDDGTREILMRLADEDSRLRIVDNPDLIVSSGLNIAIREAKGSVIVRMDAHTEFASDYIQNCLEALQSTGADNVGGPWIAKGTGLIGRAIAAAFQSPFCFGGRRGHNADYEGVDDTVYLGCWRRPLFDRIGFFDEELVRNQDDEFNLRLSRLGGKIWQTPRIKSWYKPRESITSLFVQYKQYGYWKVPVIQKHRIPASIRHLIPGLFVLSLIGLTLASFWSTAAAQGWWFLVAAYSVYVLIASLLTAGTKGWNLFPCLPLVFACYHLAYGYGFLRGVIDFIVLQRDPRPAYSKLSRATTEPLPPQEI